MMIAFYFLATALMDCIGYTHAQGLTVLSYVLDIFSFFFCNCYPVGTQLETDTKWKIELIVVFRDAVRLSGFLTV